MTSRCRRPLSGHPCRPLLRVTHPLKSVTEGSLFQSLAAAVKLQGIQAAYVGFAILLPCLFPSTSNPISAPDSLSVQYTTKRFAGAWLNVKMAIAARDKLHNVKNRSVEWSSLYVWPDAGDTDGPKNPGEVLALNHGR